VLILVLLGDAIVPELRIATLSASPIVPESSITTLNPVEMNVNPSPNPNLRKYTFPFIIFTALICLDFWWQEFYINHDQHIWLNLVLGISAIAYLIFSQHRKLPVPMISHVSLTLLLITFIFKIFLIEGWMPIWLMMILNIVSGWVFGTWISAIWQLWTQEFKGPHHGFIIISYLIFTMLFCGIFTISVSLFYERELDFGTYIMIIIGFWVISAGGFLIGNFKKITHHKKVKEESP
jgi:hypothetical protein